LSELVLASAENVGARRYGRVGGWAFYRPPMPSGRLDFTADLPRKRMASRLPLVDSRQRAPRVEPAYKVSWELPGGCVEIDESPYRAAAREGHEEPGLERWPGRLLVVAWVPPCHGRDPLPRQRRPDDLTPDHR
jgi:hypothetical protein